MQQEEFEKLTINDLERLKFVLDANWKVCIRWFWVKWDNWNTILSGNIDPTTEWVDGDFYINTTSWQIFWPKSWTWGTWTNLKWQVQTVVWGSNITIDNTDPNNPVINYDWEVVFNVKDFWAIWDWIANDTIAFQDAVNATWTNWWRVIIPYGTYNLTSFPTIWSKSIYFDIDVWANFNGTWLPRMSTNPWQLAVWPYIKSQSIVPNPLPPKGWWTAAFNVETLPPTTYVWQSVALYAWARWWTADVDANVWAINSLISALPTALWTYQCIEVDVNNHSPSALVKWVSISWVWEYNPRVAFEAVRADETRWQYWMELYHSLIWIVVHGSSSSKYEWLRLENLDSTDTINKWVTTKYYWRSFNTPTSYEVAETEINPIDSDWNNTRYTLSIRANSTFQSIFEAKNTWVFFWLDTVDQNHIIRQWAGTTRFRRDVNQYIELKTDTNYHYIVGTVNNTTGWSASGKEILIENKDQAWLRYKFNWVEVWRVTKNGSIIIWKVTDDGSYLQVSNASASWTYATIKRWGSWFDIALNSANNEINSTWKVMRIWTTDALPIALHTNWLEKMRVHSSWNISIWDTGNTNKLKVTWSVWDSAWLIYLSTSWTWKKAFKFDEWFTTTTAPTWDTKYITIDIWWVEYKLIAQATT